MSSNSDSSNITAAAESLVLTLKRQALEHKNAGDIEAAKKSLGQARLVGALDINNPADLKKLAVFLKQNGNVASAKQALLQSKKVEAAAAAALETSSSMEDDEVAESADATTATPPPKKKYEDPVNQAMDEANLDELYQNSSNNKTVTYTDEELLDVETMADMKGAGMDIPSQDVYEERALACKRAALAAKQKGDLATAKARLVQSKQFTKAVEVLFGEGVTGLQDEDDGEDYSLLDELMEGHSSNKVQDDDGFFEQLFGKSSTAIELDDLDDLDPSMLRDMMENGMEIPNVEEVLKTAKDKKTLAIQCKKQGDLPAAQAALQEAKRLESRAKQLSDMLRAIESGACDDEPQNLDPEALLERMLEKSENTHAETAQAPAAAAAVPTKLLSSHEYKVQAVQFKQQGQMTEALEQLRLYKQALAAETTAKAAAQRQEYVTAVHKEAQWAAAQSRLFSFYEWFVDQEVGRAQVVAWKAYAQECESAAFRVESNDEEAFGNLQRSAEVCDLKEIREPDLGFIGKTVDPADQRIEVCLLEGSDLQANKHLREVLGIEKDVTMELPDHSSLRIVVTSQIPASMEYPDDDVILQYEPCSKVDAKYVFQGSKFLNAERGSSRFAKLINRRLGRKKLTFDVFCVSVKKSLFKTTSEDHLLGTAVVELKDLLQKNWIAGDFPLLNATRRHELGGQLRIAIRSGSPFGEQVATENEEKEKPFTANTGLSSKVAKLQYYAPLQL